MTSKRLLILGLFAVALSLGAFRALDYIQLINTTAEDTDGGRETQLRFRGTQSGSEVTTLGIIEMSHDGAVDDEKGKGLITVNDGNDLDAPSITVMSWNSAGLVTFGGGSTTPHAWASVVSEQSDNNIINILSTNTTDTGVFFGDPDDTFVGGFRYDNNIDSQYNYVNNVVTAFVDSSGFTQLDTNISALATAADAQLEVGNGTATSIDGTDDLLVQDDVEIDGDLYVEGSNFAAPDKLYSWTGAGLLATKPAGATYDAIAPTSAWTGTNATVWTASYDSTTVEARGVQFTVPEDVSASGNVTFRVVWYSETATTGNVLWTFAEADAPEGTSWDVAPTERDATADAVQGTTRQVTHTTWTVAVGTLGWTAGELITGWLVRDTDDAADTMNSDDAEVLQFSISVPRS